MKHNLKITTFLIAMFILTQLIGLFVIDYYIRAGNNLPYGMAAPEISETEAWSLLGTFLVSFVIAIVVILVLVNLKSIWVMKAWFFIVVTLALGIAINIATQTLHLPYPGLLALVLALIFAYFKIFKRNTLIHNATELLIYPGIAAVFVPILNIYTIILLLIAISIYDIWAVWHSGIMQKMAKFQIDNLKIFSGFFIPYASKEVREKIKLLKLKYKNKKEIPAKVIKKQGLRVNLAILGGGDVVFPIIAAGVVFKTFNNIYSALSVTLFAALALLCLFIFAKKKKFYPAMPFITAGIFIGMLVGWLINSNL